MNLMVITARIKRLAKVDKAMAQREADIALRAAVGVKAVCAIKGAMRAAGLRDTAAFL
jgi:cytolysin (calcineurin-like family phosphatase)